MYYMYCMWVDFSFLHAAAASRGMSEGLSARREVKSSGLGRRCHPRRQCGAVYSSRERGVSAGARGEEGRCCGVGFPEPSGTKTSIAHAASSSSRDVGLLGLHRCITLAHRVGVVDVAPEQANGLPQVIWDLGIGRQLLDIGEQKDAENIRHVG